MSPAAMTSAEAQILLAPHASLESVEALLRQIGFLNPRGTWEYLQDIAQLCSREVWEGVLPPLLRLLASTVHPDAVVVQLSRLVQSAPQPTELLGLLEREPRSIDMLVRLFVSSQYLSEILIAHPTALARLTQQQWLAEAKSRQQFLSEAESALADQTDETAQWSALRRYQRWELLRIGLCDSFGMLDLRMVTVQLSLLADALVQACLNLAARRTGKSADGLAVIALGKLGGEELNYSSDIDLVFLAEEQPEQHWQVVQKLIRGLNVATGAGFLYRVDLRLRPWGQAGPLVSSVESYFDYLKNSAELWERQALLKARVIAGDEQVGRRFLEQLPQHLFNLPAEVLRKKVRETKQKIEAGAVDPQRSLADVKLGVGSIRDVEFVTQYLQLRHGGAVPQVRSFNTLEALVRLAETDLIQANEYRILTEGYVFLRKVEHALQLLHNKQTHSLPQGESDLEALAVRLDFPSGGAFAHHHEQHRARIREVYQRYLGHVIEAAVNTVPASPVEQHIARMEQNYTVAFSPAEIEQHALLAQSLSDEHLVEFEAEPFSEQTWQVTIVAFDYLGELSLICGLLFDYGFDILAGQVFTYHASLDAAGPAEQTVSGSDLRQKIVDVFLVRHNEGPVPADVWQRYRAELTTALERLHRGDQQVLQGDLARRIASGLARAPVSDAPLYPVDIELDNTSSERYTLLRIRGRDTPGFLYELTHALALHGVRIGSVELRAVDDQAHDTLWVTDAQGLKITGETAGHQLRAATVLTKHFMHLLPRSPNPTAAMLHFREFIAQLFTRPDWPSELASLERTEVLDALARLLGVSDFLWNDFLRMQYESLFPVVKNVAALHQAVSRVELEQQLGHALSMVSSPAHREAILEEFRDREMFRVDMRHILELSREFHEFSAELTDVAEVVVEAAWELSRLEFEPRYGQPRTADGQPCAIVVCALGKCGGREMGFASDIELMFLYSGEGRTTGLESITTLEYTLKRIERLLQLLKTKREGIFEIDLRMRPYGRAGDLAVSRETFATYFSAGGAAWPYERQALVKLRPIAGDLEFGREIVQLRDALLYSGAEFNLRAMRGMRERQRQQLVTAGTINAKFSAGGIVDIEYYVQGLQISHGQQHPALRETNTLIALEQLSAQQLLSSADTVGLRAAYIFGRRLIDGLRMVRGDARDLTVPPAETEDFRFLARRLDYATPEELAQDLQHHLEQVQQITEVGTDSTD